MEIRIENMISWKNLLLFFLALACIMAGVVVLGPENYDWMIRLEGLGIVIAVVLYLRVFLRKNYIGYSGTGMIVRTGRDGGKIFRYTRLKDATIDKGLLQLDLKNGIQMVVDLDEADPKEIGKLKTILEKKFR